ncbi:MAG: hypothetical protein M1824_004906 [Vezdaea acicularis]|nr:MAG: hypothetical protein M1824_004906 [Vezdaea acicularis]
MSEYWKSTPRYHCKHCNLHVRDTPLERRNHESSPKHQGNIKRFLRDLNRTNDRAQRDAQRAKDEVARLNGIVGAGSNPPGSAASTSTAGRGVGPAAATTDRLRGSITLTHGAGAGKQRAATPSERKEQLRRLAEMGVAIPEEFRGEMAMVGDWEVLHERVVGSAPQQDPDQEGGEVEGSLGVRRKRTRTADGDAAAAMSGDEEEKFQVGHNPRKKRWGDTLKTYPALNLAGDEEEEKDDLDALLQAALPTKKEGLKPVSHPDLPGLKTEDSGFPTIKKEEEEEEGGDQAVTAAREVAPIAHVAGVKTEEGVELPPTDAGEDIIFKKRKTRSTKLKLK